MNVVRQIPLLAGLGPIATELIRSTAYVSTYKPAQVTFREGDEGNTRFAVAEGYLKATCAVPDGRQMLLCLIGRGDVFWGELRTW